MTIITTPDTDTRDTDTRDTEQDSTAPVAPTVTATATVEHIDPQLIQFEDNVRNTVELDKGFVASIKSEGVLLPVLARRGEDGTIYVRDGQRRTLAAREAGLATIPAYFGTVSETKTARIVQQLVTNDRRAAISDAQRVTAYHQLTLEGMTPTAIARKTGEKKATVEASITIAKSAHAIDAIGTGQITLDAALILAEFEDDPDTVTELTEIALDNPNALTHAAQRARENRDRAGKIAAVVAEYTAAGTRTVTDDDDNTGTSLSRLTDDEDTRTAVDADTHTGCPGHALFIESYWGGEIRATPVCLDPETHGHKSRLPNPTYSASTPQTGPRTDEQKAERRQVIENNRAWDAAEQVRIDWLTTLLSRKTLPKDAAQFIAVGLTSHRQVTGTGITNGNAVASKILGAENTEGRWGTDRLAQYVEKTPTKAQHVTLAVILGGIEGSLDRNTWRRSTRHAAAYLTRLAGWGYTLSNVEQLTIDTATPRVNAAEAAPEPDATAEAEAEAEAGDFDPYTDYDDQADADLDLDGDAPDTID